MRLTVSPAARGRRCGSRWSFCRSALVIVLSVDDHRDGGVVVFQPRQVFAPEFPGGGRVLGDRRREEGQRHTWEPMWPSADFLANLHVYPSDRRGGGVRRPGHGGSCESMA